MSFVNNNSNAELSSHYPFYFFPQGLSAELYPKRLIAGKFTKTGQENILQLSLLKDKVHIAKSSINKDIVMVD